MSYMNDSNPDLMSLSPSLRYFTVNTVKKMSAIP